MATIYLLNHNNYYNRIAKKPISLETAIANAVVTRSPFNFIPGDGVNTEAVINYTEDIVANYFVYSHNNKISRWFIVESIRTSAGQYRLQLHRDLIADAYDDVLTAPMFIEKATLSNDDPFIFNSEQMTFNQIKVKETLLKDSTNNAWIVGYCDSTNDLKLDNVNGQQNWDEEVAMSSAEWLEQHGDVNFLVQDKTKLYISFRQGTQNKGYYMVTGKNAPKKYFPIDRYYSSSDYLKVTKEDNSDLDTFDFNQCVTTYAYDLSFNDSEWAVINYQIKQAMADRMTLVTENPYINLPNRIIKCTNGLFKVAYSESTPIQYNTTTEGYYFKSIDGTGLQSTVINNFNNFVYSFFENPQFSIKTTSVNGAPRFGFFYSTVSVALIPYQIVDENAINFIATPSARDHLEDNPYDMFYMPDSPLNRQLANLLMIHNDTKVYDCQLLPYCPDIYGYEHPTEKNRFPVTKGSTAISYIYFNKKSSRNIILNYSIAISNKKIDNETKIWRLCSPNYNGVFEFNAAKNNGVLNFEVDLTYLPFNPYIHIHPKFDGLYGTDFEDARGLICGGDFSIPRVKDAWESYQLQNKNYQQIFDRSIQNMEVTQNAQRISEITGIIGGTMIGAAAGGKLGGGVGAVAGAALSAIGGVVDYSVNETLRNEAIDYRKDQFGYQLGNIKALPQSISKTTAYNANNKYFPFIEEYDCTDKEKNAFINKLKYNGMTVMRIGTISEFLQTDQTYIKGKLIRMESSNYDNHFTNQLANELYMGVYISSEE